MKLRNILLFGIGIAIGVQMVNKANEYNAKNEKNGSDNYNSKVINNLYTKAENLLDQAKSLKSDEIRIGIEKKLNDLKNVLKDVDVKELSDSTIKLVQTLSKTLREIALEIISSPQAKSKKIASKKSIKKTSTMKNVANVANEENLNIMTMSELKKIAARRNVKFLMKDTKKTLIKKIQKAELKKYKRQN
ncbi:MAG: hypothetical protein NC236_00600 [Mycoplasma sp.]|nr:hypothetical protein [Mycoplasma sp.]